MEVSFSCERARNICIVKTLAKLGHLPTRTTVKEAWFLSPFRSETQASFNVSLSKNLWYDFGIGKGGSTIDLIMVIRSCSIKEALEFLEQKTVSCFKPPAEQIQFNNKILIVGVEDIDHPALKHYLKTRNIPLKTASQYCWQIRYMCKNKEYFAVGLRNYLEGWELRNRYFKGSSSPKSFTHLKTASRRLLLTEGMFDFLSLATLEKEMVESSDCIILNSLSFLDKVKGQISGYEQIQIYFDNDPAGDIATNELISRFDNATDKRISYRNYKDLNERLQN